MPAARLTAMPTTPSAIPVGTQFSPDLLDLSAFLAAVIAHSGDKPAMMDAVWKKPVRIAPVAAPPTKRRKSLPLEAAVQYGLLKPKLYEATDLAVELAKLSGGALDTAFAKHILLECGGLRVVEGAQQMALDGLRVGADPLARYLSAQGFVVVEHNTAINSLRMWLSRAGVFGANDWKVNAATKEKLLGLADDQIAALVGLTDEQRAFAIALCRINPPGDYKAAEVRKLAETIVGHPLARGSAPNNFLKPLEKMGFITWKSGGTGGGKTATLKTTATFKKEVLEPFLETTVKSLDAALTAYYRKDPADTYKELASTDTGVKGRALEAYAVHVMRHLGLRFLFWRKRATDNPAEIDVVMTGMLGGMPTRWQIQCKNTPTGKVDLEDVAKEVGLLPLTKATHIMVIANCGFTGDAQRYATEVMRQSPTTIYLLDKADFARIRKSPGEIGEVLREKSAEAAAIRRGQTMWDA
jgi:hypothetical protein